MPWPSSETWMSLRPPSLMTTVMEVDWASRLFSISSLTADTGRWMTSPAAILFTTDSSKRLICGGSTNLGGGGTSTSSISIPQSADGGIVAVSSESIVSRWKWTGLESKRNPWKLQRLLPSLPPLLWDICAYLAYMHLQNWQISSRTLSFIIFNEVPLLYITAC